MFTPYEGGYTLRRWVHLTKVGTPYEGGIPYEGGVYLTKVGIPSQGVSETSLFLIYTHLIQFGQNVLGFSNTAHSWKNVFDSIVMLFF